MEFHQNLAKVQYESNKIWRKKKAMNGKEVGGAVDDEVRILMKWDCKSKNQNRRNTKTLLKV